MLPVAKKENDDNFALIKQLFSALDDSICAEYYNYQKYNGEYPSELAIDALQKVEMFGLKSKALQQINDSLAEDIQRDK